MGLSAPDRLIFRNNAHAFALAQNLDQDRHAQLRHPAPFNARRSGFEVDLAPSTFLRVEEASSFADNGCDLRS
jgi:hypothetical protein